jgi:hypothetical protein
MATLSCAEFKNDGTIPPPPPYILSNEAQGELLPFLVSSGAFVQLIPSPRLSFILTITILRLYLHVKVKVMLSPCLT